MEVRIPYPICYRCKTKIQDMTVSESFGLDGLLITVKCHGKTDSCVLRHAVLRLATKIHAGYAFKNG